MPETGSFTTALLSVGELLRRLYTTVLEEQDVSLTHFAILHIVETHGEPKMAEMTRLLDMTKGNMSYHVDQLESLGWVVRDLNDRDRRITRLKLTPAGKALMDRVATAFDGRIEAMIARIPPTEGIMIKAGLDLLNARGEMLIDRPDAAPC
jgi:DNA-binding MarR family transcriptional regulator